MLLKILRFQKMKNKDPHDIDEVVMNFLLGKVRYRIFDKVLTPEETRVNEAYRTEVSAIGIMRRAIGGAKYHETLVLNNGHFWDGAGMDWLKKMDYIHDHIGIYLPTPEGITWFNHMVEKKELEPANETA